MIKKISIISIQILALLFLVLVVLVNFKISAMTVRTFNSVSELPYHETGIVLGTAAYNEDGTLNEFLYNRLKAAALAYEQQKILKIIVSGKVEGKYDETTPMREFLLKAGVRAADITVDSQGSRTIFSVRNAKNTYHLADFTVISQRFHNERALYIASHLNLKVDALNAEDVEGVNSILIMVREFFARFKCFIECIMI